MYHAQSAYYKPKIGCLYFLLISAHLDSVCPGEPFRFLRHMNEAQAIDRMRQVIRRQHKALATEDAYVLWLRRYMKALRYMTPEFSSQKKLEHFLTDLARK